MAITIPKPSLRPTKPEDFIAAAPDAVVDPLEPTSPKTLKAKRGTHRSQVSVVLADELITRIDEASARQYMSRSAFITMALNRWLDQST